MTYPTIQIIDDEAQPCEAYEPDRELDPTGPCLTCGFTGPEHKPDIVIHAFNPYPRERGTK